MLHPCLRELTDHLVRRHGLAGRAELAARGIDPELLRLSVGCEPVDDIIATLAEALDA